jgi:uncharacterized CHY-type Zn-finger protein
MASTSARRVLCSHCARRWQSDQYKTCDPCRQRTLQLECNRRLHAIAETERHTSIQPSPLPSAVPVSSTQRTLCSGCARSWSSTRYKTCNDCRRKNARAKTTRLPPPASAPSAPTSTPLSSDVPAPRLCCTSTLESRSFYDM